MDVAIAYAEDTRGRNPAPIFGSDFPSRKSAPVFDLKNRRRFLSPKTDVAEKSDEDAVAAAIMHSYSCKS